LSICKHFSLAALTLTFKPATSAVFSLVQPGLEHLALVLGRPHQASKGGVDDPLPLYLLVLSKLATFISLAPMSSKSLAASWSRSCKAETQTDLFLPEFQFSRIIPTTQY
jgi:hypothetical protein